MYKTLKKSIQAKYKSHICIYYTIFSIYSQYILIYYIDKSAKRGGTHKNLISSKSPHNCKPILLTF